MPRIGCLYNGYTAFYEINLEILHCFHKKLQKDLFGNIKNNSYIKIKTKL